MADVASVNENVTGWYSEMFASGASRVLLFPQESLLAGPLFPSFAFCTSCPLVCLRLCHPCHPAAKPILNQFGGSYDNICPLAYLWSMMSMLCTLAGEQWPSCVAGSKSGGSDGTRGWLVGGVGAPAVLSIPARPEKSYQLQARFEMATHPSHWSCLIHLGGFGDRSGCSVSQVQEIRSKVLNLIDRFDIYALYRLIFFQIHF